MNCNIYNSTYINNFTLTFLLAIIFTNPVTANTPKTYSVSCNLKYYNKPLAQGYKAFDQLDLENASCMINQIMPKDYLKYPPNFSSRSNKEQTDWLTSDHVNKKMKQWIKIQKRFKFKLDKKSNFKFSGLPKGKYRIIINIRSKNHGGRVTHIALTARTDLNAIDLNTNDANENNHITLQNFKAYPHWNLDFGQQMPPLQLKDLNNKTIRLSDYHGKFVILDFWATWCGPCIKQTPYLKKAYEKYSDKLEIIAISYDKNEKTLKQYIKKHNLKWPSTFVGLDTPLAEQISYTFGVASYPTMHLIDPQGRYIEHLYRENNMDMQLTRWLKFYQDNEKYENYFKSEQKGKLELTKQYKDRILLK